MLRVGIDADHVAFLNGIVDSGADGTLLPKEMAPAMGIKEEDLVLSEDSNSGAGGTSFPTWLLPTGVVLTGQVVAFTPGVTMWGPEIMLKPQFAENTTTLYGRADFFQPFVITFFNDTSGVETFCLDY